MIMGINILAALAAAFVAFLLGGVWYSPVLFGRIWMREAGVTKSVVKKGHSPLDFAIAFFFALVAAIVFALFLGDDITFLFALGTGFAVGLGWVATSFGINYLFAGRSWKLLLIDAGYHIAQFTLYGFVFGLWR